MPDDNCKICGSVMEKLFVKEKAPFGTAEYKQCQKCGFIYSDHIERAEKNVVSEFYKKCSFDQEDPGYVSRAKTAFSLILKICSRIKANPKYISLLDYGCGEGSFLLYCLNEGINAAGYDPYCKAGKINNEYILTDERIGELKEAFDIVTSLEVVEHATSPQIFSTLLDLCKPGGYICFSTGMYNAAVHNSDWDYFAPAHCSIYSVESLSELVKKMFAKRVCFIRYPFVDRPHLLTGELWIKSLRYKSLCPHTKDILSKDTMFSILSKYLPKHFYKPLANLIYRNNYFI